MTERTADYDLIVTVRVYGPGSAEDAARALMDYGTTFDLPRDAEVEILNAQHLPEHNHPPVMDHLREAVRRLHRPLWYRVPFTGRPEGQAWLVCDGCGSEPSWPCKTAELVYAPEEIEARKPQVPECSEGHAHHRAVFWQQVDGTLTARRSKCDHVASVPVTSSDPWG
jgi:hypothetical protein